MHLAKVVVSEKTSSRVEYKYGPIGPCDLRSIFLNLQGYECSNDWITFCIVFDGNPSINSTRKHNR